jgi:hypothetical protein
MQSTFRKYLTISLVLLPALLYFTYWYYFSQNIPHWDDYAIIAFADKLQNQNLGFFQKVALFFSQHNEHRIVFTRFWAMVSVWATGLLNFKFLMAVGNLALVVILLLFARIFAKQKLPLSYLIPVSVLVFQLPHYENTYWGMASVQNFWVVSFSLLAIYQLAKGRIPYLFLPLAAFTSANASVLLPIIGLILLFFDGDRSKVFKFSILSALVLLFYFLNYAQPPDSQPINISNIFLNIKATFVSIGSNIDLNTNYDLAKRISITWLFGAFITLVIMVFTGFYTKQLMEQGGSQRFLLIFVIGVFLFAIGTCAMATLSRVQYGMYVFLVSRYKVYGCVALLALYSLVLVYLQEPIRKIFAYISIVLAAVFCLNASYFTLPKIYNYQKTELANYYNGWHIGQNKPEPSKNSVYNYINNKLDYVPVNEVVTERLALKVNVHSEYILLESPDFNKYFSASNSGAYLEFVSEKGRFIFAAFQKPQGSKLQLLLTGLPTFAGGLDAQVPLTSLPTDQYFVNILYSKNEKIYRIPVKYYLEIEGKTAPTIKQNW